MWWDHGVRGRVGGWLNFFASASSFPYLNFFASADLLSTILPLAHLVRLSFASMGFAAETLPATSLCSAFILYALASHSRT